MKTRNNQTENRNNRYFQVVLRVAAVMASVVLLSATVSAQGLWKELLSINSMGKVAMLTVDNNAAETKTPAASTATSFYIEEETDTPIDLQDWMSSDSYFRNFEHLDEVAPERTLEIENWMTNEAYFISRFAAEKDEARPIEAWMCNADFFGK
ncbi:MAG: hypothetical protein ACK5JD_03290 [Mangrovibacterium sp.]